MSPAELYELKGLLRKAMQRRCIERAECFGKQGFDNRVDAQRSIRSREMRRVCTVYRCQFCARYHVGSDVEERKKQKAMRMVKGMKEQR